MIPALAAAKASVAQLVISITPTRLLKHLCYTTLGFTAACAIASMLALAFQCRLPKPWDTEGQKCVDRLGLNIGIHSLNIITDLCVTVIPLVMLQDIQVSQKKRWVVRGLFASRCRYEGPLLLDQRFWAHTDNLHSVPVFTILMLYYMRIAYRTENPNFTWDILVPQVWAQVMLHTSIITACIPSLKPFLSGIKPGLLTVQIPGHELTSSSIRRSQRESKSEAAKGGPLVGPRSFTSRSSSTKKRLSNTTTSISNSSSGNSNFWTEKQKQAIATMERGYNRPQAGKTKSRVEHGRSESIQALVQSLTDHVILHSIDYKVEYEEPRDELDIESLSRLGSSHSHV